jgi:hypothetical protein
VAEPKVKEKLDVENEFYIEYEYEIVPDPCAIPGFTDPNLKC